MLLSISRAQTPRDKQVMLPRVYPERLMKPKEQEVNRERYWLKSQTRTQPTRLTMSRMMTRLTMSRMMTTSKMITLMSRMMQQLLLMK